MAVDVPLDELLSLVGHDGGRIAFPEYEEPLCRQGVHVQECIEAIDQLGFSATPIELIPAARTPGPNWGERLIQFGEKFPLGNWARWNRHLLTSQGVITGNARRCGHAVAYDHGRIFDPDGYEFDYSREACEACGFYTDCLWKVSRTHK